MYTVQFKCNYFSTKVNARSNVILQCSLTFVFCMTIPRMPCFKTELSKYTSSSPTCWAYTFEDRPPIELELEIP